jgi:Dolichyl-phosphate-mannose-protein mannosyltransferase
METNEKLTARAPRLGAWRIGRVSALNVAVVVAVGLVIRAVIYSAGYSFTLDEAFVALNVQRKSAGGLLGQLDWNSAAPPGFLEIEKVLASLFGTSELVLRAPSFVASVAALVLFALLARRVSEASTAMVAVLLFVGVALVSSYSALAKPYSFDVLFIVALYLATVQVLQQRQALGPAIALAVLGIVAPVFAYAALFGVAASAAVLVVDAVARRSRTASLRTALVVGPWLLLLAIAYAVHGSTFSHLRHSIEQGHSGLGSVRFTVGAVRVVLGVSPTTNTLGAAFAVVATICAGLLFVVGVVHVARRSWQVAALLVLPGVFAGVASLPGWYPSLARTMLFLAPMLVIFIAEGSIAAFRHTGAAVRPLALVALAVLLVAEGASTANAIDAVRPDNGMKPIMDVLAARARQSDTIYLGYAAQYPFAYYLACDCADPSVERAVEAGSWDVAAAPGTADQWSPALRARSRRLVIGRFRGYGLDGYVRDFANLPRHGRVWIVLSFLHPDERRSLLAHLDERGKRLKTFGAGSSTDSVTAYLYAF